MNLIQTFTALIGLTTGFIGAYFGNYARWIFERKKMIYLERKALLVELRTLLEIDNYENGAFRQSNAYLRLKPHLLKDSISRVEGHGFGSESYKNRIEVSLTRDGMKVNYFRETVLCDLNRLESLWKII